MRNAGLIIEDIRARQIYDSRGFPTVEVEVGLVSGDIGRAAVASTGSHEALELRDGNGSDYASKGVNGAVLNVMDRIVPNLLGFNASDQAGVDHLLCELDGTYNKAQLGANATLPVSMAVARAAAAYLGLPLCQYLGGRFGRTLPLPMMNFINGGKHAGKKGIQEFMVLPVGAPDIAAAIRMGGHIYYELRRLLAQRDMPTTVGDEGGFAPPLTSVDSCIILNQAIKAAGYQPGRDVCLGLDCAATEFYDPESGMYEIDGKDLSVNQLIELYNTLANAHGVISIEDGLAEDDWENWSYMTEVLGRHVLLVGDDIFVTNSNRLRRGIKVGAGNAILIKLNQIGTLTETIETMELARRYGYVSVVSHRSGETEDTFIADLAVAMNAGLIKTGAIARSERVAKYNQLIRIEEELGDAACFLGWGAFTSVPALASR